MKQDLLVLDRGAGQSCTVLTHLPKNLSTVLKFAIFRHFILTAKIAAINSSKMPQKELINQFIRSPTGLRLTCSSLGSVRAYFITDVSLC